MLPSVVKKFGEGLLGGVDSISAKDTRARHRAEYVTAEVVEMLFARPMECPPLQLGLALLMYVLVRSVIASASLRVDVQAVDGAPLIHEMLTGLHLKAISSRADPGNDRIGISLRDGGLVDRYLHVVEELPELARDSRLF